MQGYTDKIIQYAADETYVGLLDNPDGVGEVGLRGQEKGNRLAVRFTLKISDEHIQKIRYQVFGCGFTIAACAAAAELSEGHSLQEIRRYTPELITDQLGGLPADRDYCAQLASEALQAAVRSAENGANPVSAELQSDIDDEQAPLISRKEPLYRSLLDTDIPPGIFCEDRQMFACLLTLALKENELIYPALGLKPADINKILAIYFPGFNPDKICHDKLGKEPRPLEINHGVLDILLSHVPCDLTGKRAHISELLAKIIAARASQPGHLWVAMAFLERPQLTAAIRRHLPTLAIANAKGMRWKRYLFKQVCDINGGTMCKSPNCGDCSDYEFCFAPEDE